MINLMTMTATDPQSASTMPMRQRASASAFHGVSAMGGVSVIAAAPVLPIDTTGVSAYCGATDVVKGAFPGTSAWSPPI